MAALTLSLVTLLTTLCGCHGSRSQNAFTVPDSFDESRQYEITFWAKNDTNKTQVDIYSKAIADFQALYPNITVKLRLYTDYGKIYNDVITNIATNTTPNVCITYPDHIATYLTGDNVVAPLDALFADEQYGLGGSALRYDGPASEEMISRFLEECSFSGSHYAVPFMRSTEACYVNRTYVEALGYELPETLTWDFVWEVSEAAAAAYREAHREGPSGDALDHERKIIVSFDSTFDVMECEQLCLDAGVPGRIMPLPGSITAGCGLCWAMPFSGDALAAFRAATEGRITPADYHQLVL